MSRLEDIEKNLLGEVCASGELYLGPRSRWLREALPRLLELELVVSETTDNGGAWIQPTSAGRKECG